MDASEVLDLARESLPTMRTTDPLYEDLLSEAILAILEDRDPREAVMAYRDREIAWQVRTLLLPRTLQPAGSKIVTEQLSTT